MGAVQSVHRRMARQHASTPVPENSPTSVWAWDGASVTQRAGTLVGKPPHLHVIFGSPLALAMPSCLRPVSNTSQLLHLTNLIVPTWQDGARGVPPHRRRPALIRPGARDGCHMTSVHTRDKCGPNGVQAWGNLWAYSCMCELPQFASSRLVAHLHSFLTRRTARPQTRRTTCDCTAGGQRSSRGH